MHITPFSVWQKEMVEEFFDEHPDGEITCPECDGDGDVLEDCFECGHESTQDCDLCDGSGVAIFARANTRQLYNRVFTMARYLEQIKHDVRRYGAYTQKNHYAIAAESGFRVYCNRNTRREVWETA